MTYPSNLDGREAFLLDILRSAGEVVLEGFRKRDPGGFSLKGPQDYLTETDSKSETHIRNAIEQAFPEDTVFGEEDGGEISQSTWVVDPIDGTANFARGLPHVCISIGYVKDRKTLLGGIYNPMTDEMYLARQGHGATLNGVRLNVSSASNISSASVELGWSTRVESEVYITCVRNLLDSGFNVRRCGSGALALAQVADGRSDAYAELHMNAWDCLPGLLMVVEAGGYVSPFLEAGDLVEGAAILASAPGVSEAFSACTGIPALDSRT